MMTQDARVVLLMWLNKNNHPCRHIHIEDDVLVHSTERMYKVENKQKDKSDGE